MLSYEIGAGGEMQINLDDSSSRKLSLTSFFILLKLMMVPVSWFRDCNVHLLERMYNKPE
jgi:hypothetical protein